MLERDLSIIVAVSSLIFLEVTNATQALTEAANQPTVHHKRQQQLDILDDKRSHNCSFQSGTPPLIPTSGAKYIEEDKRKSTGTMLINDNPKFDEIMEWHRRMNKRLVKETKEKV